MDYVRIGIVGIGVIGTKHAKSIFSNEVENVKLTAVCDVKKSRLEWAKEYFGGDVACFEKAEDLFDSGLVDAVIIAAPHYFHPGYSIKAFEKGLHVLCEKPAGVYTKQVMEMNEAAKKSGKVFSMMYNQRANAYYQKLRDMVKNGELGEIKRSTWIVTNWYRAQCYYNSSDWRATWKGEGGGVLINQCPHNLDIWQWVCGMPERIRGFCQFGKYHDIEVEDNVTAYLEYKSGATGVLITTTGEAAGTNRLEVIGEKGKVIIEEDNDKYKMTFYKFEQSEREFNATFTGGIGEPEHEMIEIKIDNVVSYSQSHPVIIQNFVNAILFGEQLIAPGEEGIKGLTISNAIHLSTWTDDWVYLPIDCDLYLEELNKRIKESELSEKA